jgi:hypothetical protein
MEHTPQFEYEVSSYFYPYKKSRIDFFAFIMYAMHRKSGLSLPYINPILRANNTALSLFLLS